jgi:hypothetical protein
MGGYGKPDCLGVKIPGGITTADTTTVFPAGVLCNERFSSTWAVGKQFPDMSSELPDVFIVEFSAAKRRLATSHLPLRRVGLTLLFSAFEGFVFYKESLPFVALTGTTPFQHDGRKA